MWNISFGFPQYTRGENKQRSSMVDQKKPFGEGTEKNGGKGDRRLYCQGYRSVS